MKSPLTQSALLGRVVSPSLLHQLLRIMIQFASLTATLSPSSTQERPQTSAITARRMVAGALGLRSNIPREQREREREQLRKAKELRRAKTSVAARTDAWEGEFAEEG